MEYKSRFPGSRPFESTEHELFFGRDSDSKNLFLKVFSNDITLVYGSSGTGKTSFINCGFIPLALDAGHLVARFRFKDFNNDCTEVSGEVIDSIESISKALKYDFSIQDDLPTQWLPGDEDSLLDAFYLKLEETYKEKVDEKKILIFDQFEELFTVLDEKSQRAIFDLIISILESHSGWCILIGIREEYVGYLISLHEELFGVFDSLFHVMPLSKEAAQLAIDRPSLIPIGENKSILKIADSVAKKIVSECANKSNFEYVDMFLLSLFCYQLESSFCQKSNKSQVNVDHLSDHWFHDQRAEYYERALNRTYKGKNQRRICNKLLSNEFITKAGYRRLRKEKEIVNWFLYNNIDKYKATAIIDRLLESRLLRVESIFQEKRYEISHDTIAHIIYENNQKRSISYLILKFIIAIFFISLIVIGGWEFYKNNLEKNTKDLKSQRELLIEQVKELIDQRDYTLIENNEIKEKNENELKKIKKAHELKLNGLIGDHTQNIKRTIKESCNQYFDLFHESLKSSSYTRAAIYENKWSSSRCAFNLGYGENISNFTKSIINKNSVNDVVMNVNKGIFPRRVLSVSNDLITFYNKPKSYIRLNDSNQKFSIKNNSFEVPVKNMNDIESLKFIRSKGKVNFYIENLEVLQTTSRILSSQFDYSEDRKRLIFIGDGRLHLCRVHLSQACEVLSSNDLFHRGRVTSLLWGKSTKKEKILYTSDDLGYLYSWSFGKHGKFRLKNIIKAHNSMISDIRYVTDDLIMTVSHDGSLHIRDNETLISMRGFLSDINKNLDLDTAEYDRDSKKINAVSRSINKYSWSYDHTSYLLNNLPIDDKSKVRSISIKSLNPLNFVVGGDFSPFNFKNSTSRQDNKIFLKAGENIERIDTSTHDEAYSVFGKNSGALYIGSKRFDFLGGVHSVDFNRNSTKLIAADFKGSIKLFEKINNDWSLKHTLKIRGRGLLTTVLFDSTGQGIVIANRTNSCLSYISLKDFLERDNLTQKCSNGNADSFSFHSDEDTTIRWVEASSDGKLLAVSGDSGFIALIPFDKNKFPSNNRIHFLSGRDSTGNNAHNSSTIVWKTQFFHEDKYLSSVSSDGLLLIWDVKSQQPVFTLALPVSSRNGNALLDFDVKCKAQESGHINKCLFALPLLNRSKVLTYEVELPVHYQ